MMTMDRLFQQQRQFAGHLRDPDRSAAPAGIENRRMQVYRDLFYSNIESFISGSFPVLRSIMTDERWHTMVRHFFADYRCQTPYFMQISEEFLNYLQNGSEHDHDEYPFLLELAHYEWIELALELSQEELGATDRVLCGGAGEGLLDMVPFMSPLACVLDYQYPVHRIGPESLPDKAPQSPTFLVVHRDRDYRIHFMEINAVTARLLHLIEADLSLTARQALLQIAAELNHPNPDAVLEGGARTLADLGNREIILGARVG